MPAAVRRVLGKTLSWRGHGQDLHLDRVFVREKLRLLTSRTLFAFFAKDVIVRMPCTLLEGDTLELNLCNSDTADHVSRAKALWCAKKSNLLLVATDARGLTKDLRALLTASGYLERLIAKADEFKTVVLKLPDKVYKSVLLSRISPQFYAHLHTSKTIAPLMIFVTIIQQARSFFVIMLSF